MRRQLHGVWITEMTSADGASAVVADHGGHLMSWTPAQGGPALYLSERSQYGGANAIRGGVPIIFPQFAERGPGRHHGFARRLNWRQEFAGEEHGRAVVRYRLSQQDLSQQQGAETGWQHPFELDYEIAFAGQELQMTLTVSNPSDHSWEFGAALHTYLQVDDIDRIEIHGLQGNRYLDKTKANLAATQENATLRIAGEVDRIYMGVQQPVEVCDGARTITVRKQGFSDAVIWNPGPAGGQSDMAPTDFRAFVCVEAGAIIEPVTLHAGQRWSGSQSVTIRSK
jgi:glucose-6-phosphate 1-epimerase